MTPPPTIAEAAARFQSGELSPLDLLDDCLKRIDRYEPTVKAWAYLDRDRAKRDAAKAANEIKAGKHCGPLHGIPFGVKDVIDVFDMPTGCGSKLWANSVARQDAPCVKRLRDAGAILLGKTVTTPFAYLDPPPTRNPWNPACTPGGSSSGSAAAVACGTVLAALGTQTGGSLIRPAAFCGVCAFKPRYGRVSTEGAMPLAHSLDHVGAMAATVGDLALVYDGLAVVTNDTSEPRTFQTAENFFPDLIDPAMKDSLAGVLGKVDPSHLTLPPEFADIPMHHGRMMAHDAAAFHADRFDRHRDDYPPKIAELIERGRAVTAEQFAETLKFQRRMREAVEEKLMLLIVPSARGVAPPPDSTGDPGLNSPWSFLGFPVVGLPVARVDGLPLGVQVIAKRGQEHDLLRAASWLQEQIAFPRTLPPVPA